MSKRQRRNAPRNVQQQQDATPPLPSPQVITPSAPGPLGIPELLQLIGSFMTKSTLTTCLRISQDFYKILLPILWTSVELNIHGQNHVPSLPDLNKNGLSVRKLSILLTTHVKFQGSEVKLPRLTELAILDSQGFHGLRNEKTFVGIIKRHHLTLKSLSSNASVTDLYLNAVEQCPGLEQLSLIRQQFEDVSSWMVRYDRLWSRLRVLVWNGYITNRPYLNTNVPYPHLISLFQDLPYLLVNTKPTKLQVLELSTERANLSLIQIHLLLILKSPDLRRLRWKIYQSRNRTAFDHLFPLQALEALDFFHSPIESLTPHEAPLSTELFRNLILALPPLTELEIEYGPLDLKRP
jgi:hypothetical protein